MQYAKIEDIQQQEFCYTCSAKTRVLRAQIAEKQMKHEGLLHTTTTISDIFDYADKHNIQVIAYCNSCLENRLKGE
jgi:hypothetical protein